MNVINKTKRKLEKVGNRERRDPEVWDKGVGSISVLN